LDSVSFKAQTGQLHLLMGPSGSGKTTLLTMMAGLQRPTSGTVVLFGKRLTDYSPVDLQQLRARTMGFVFQDFQLIDSLNVFQNIALVLKFAGRSGSGARRMVDELLERFGIAYLRDRRPVKLSQGEKQRVAVARAVANNARLIIADEPTASLESAQGLGVIGLLRNYARHEQRCVIVASHDLRLVEYADTVQRIEDGVLRSPNGLGNAQSRAQSLLPRRGFLHVHASALSSKEEADS
jgi:putative ABC transport system ATP-binding protein